MPLLCQNENGDSSAAALESLLSYSQSKVNQTVLMVNNFWPWLMSNLTLYIRTHPRLSTSSLWATTARYLATVPLWAMPCPCFWVTSLLTRSSYPTTSYRTCRPWSPSSTLGEAGGKHLHSLFWRLFKWLSLRIEGTEASLDRVQSAITAMGVPATHILAVSQQVEQQPPETARQR